MNALYFLITTISSLCVGALFLRMWLFATRVSGLNPFAGFIFQITDRPVALLRKLLPVGRHIEWPSLLCAYLITLVQFALLLWLMKPSNAFSTSSGASSLLPLLLISALSLINQAISLIVWTGISYALLSWIGRNSPLFYLLDTLMRPLLNPIRRIMPRTLRNAPIDLSLMGLMLILFTLRILLNEYVTV